MVSSILVRPSSCTVFLPISTGSVLSETRIPSRVSDRLKVSAGFPGDFRVMSADMEISCAMTADCRSARNEMVVRTVFIVLPLCGF